MDSISAIDTFCGVMLSDGSLHRALAAGDPSDSCYGVIDSRFSIRQSVEQMDHMDWLYLIKESLETLGVTVSAGYPKYIDHRSRGKVFKSSVLMTTTSDILTEQRRRWYPSGKKIVSEDLMRLSPVSIANLFMGDGTSVRDHRYPNVVNVHIHCEGFETKYVKVLQRLLNNIGINDTGVVYAPSGKDKFIITVRQSNVDKFMSIIEPFIVPSFSYKIKYKCWR